MTPKIFLLAFSEADDQETSVLFQTFGSNKSNHPNLVSYFEYVDNDDTGRYKTALEQFKLTTLPTIIFTQVVEEAPLKLQSIVMIEGATTNAVLEETFNSIIGGSIPLPELGNGGVLLDDDNMVIGSDGNGGFGAGKKLKLRYPLGILATLAVARSIKKRRKKRLLKLANKAIEAAEVIEEATEEKPNKKTGNYKLAGYGLAALGAAGLTAFVLRDKNPKFPPTLVPDGPVDEALVVAMASELFEEFSNYQVEFFFRNRCDLLGRYLALSPANFVSVANYFQENFKITIRQILANLTFRPCIALILSLIHI